MKLRFGYILLAAGLLALIMLSVVRLGRERQFYELQLRQQATAIETGLREKWKAHLLMLAQGEQLPKDFVLHWDRLGRVLHTPFYPHPGIQLEWAEYREALKNNESGARKEFLQKALAIRRSWDRILALDEWRKLTPEPISGDVLDGFERAQSDPEAREAYRLLFEYFEGGRDFTFVRPQFDFDRVFFRTTAEGQLEGFLPSIASVRHIALKSFLSVNRLTSAEFDSTALEIRFPQFQTAASHGFRRRDTALLTASILLLIFGVALTAVGLREQRTLLLKRVTFLNQIVHELKTPLTGLRLNAQLIRRSGPSERNLHAIDQSIMRLDRLFDDIVQINRPESQAELKTVAANDLEELLRNFADAEFPGLVRIDGRVSEACRTELGRLRVLLRNLISNGIKYGEQVTIQVRTVPGADTIEFTVIDCGPGVSLSDAPKIFDEFFRSARAQAAESGGLGLGLSLAKKLAVELSTDVRLLNPGEAGAKFQFSLPIASQKHTTPEGEPE